MSHSPEPQPAGAGMEYELRLYGLHASITSEQLIAFFSFGVRVLDVALKPGQEGLQWAKMWVGSEREVASCLEKKLKLAENGITITRAPTQPGWVTPDSFRKPTLPPVPLNSPMQLDEVSPLISARYRTTSSGIPPRTRTESGGLGYRHVDPSGPLPRNLYVMGLPLDMTQVQFRSLFADYGMVEHSILLSQLDSMGRRRGFVLMSTHREALQALNGMVERYIEGHKIDVSWALRQKEAEQIGPGVSGLGNRVLHPPTTPVRRESSTDCSVVCDNLDPAYFSHIERLRDVLEVYGPIHRVTLLSARPSLKVLVQFEHSISAQALIGSSGSSIAGRLIITYPYSSLLTPSPVNGGIMTPSTLLMTPLSHPRPMMATTESIPKAFQFDPFHDQGSESGHDSPSHPRQLTATSRPFVPPSLSSLTISGSPSTVAPGAGAGSGPSTGSGSKPRISSGETYGSSALSRISSRSTSTGQSQTKNSQAQSQGQNANLAIEQRLADIWH